ncbi:MAG TPA: DUF1501 domain-containing protein [Pyrinomonadaceae bacterium]|jgi:uncharacterized protein (DUF1501 family)|nr:DUF1501 domain-containing protein [Pyrinomonadaceae bacterium]
MGNTSRRSFVRKLLLAPETVLPPAGDRTLVCIFLRGAADTLNMVIPYGDDEYYRLRPTIAIPPPANGTTGLRLDDFYAFHPNLAPLLPAFNEGRLGIVQAVGTDNPSGSHFEAQDQMEHGESYGHTIGGGWLGRYLRTRAADMTPLSAVAIGPTIPESLRGAPTASAIESIEEVQIKTPSGNASGVASVLSALYAAEGEMVGQAGKATLHLLRRVETLRGAVYTPENGAVYLDDDFSQGLKEIARLAKARVGLEVACLDLGGWDTHFFQGSTSGLQADLIRQLADGLAAFDKDMGAQRDRVVTLIMTEFGRRTYENSSLGTDHGRGFALFALGGLVKGGKVHGHWPGLAEESSSQTDSLNPVGPSGLKVLIDYRSVLAEVLTKFLGHRDVNQVFPNFHPEPVGVVW